MGLFSSGGFAHPSYLTDDDDDDDDDIRWSLDHNIPVIPKSTSREHMSENLSVLHSPPLPPKDRKALDALECSTKFAWDPSKVA